MLWIILILLLILKFCFNLWYPVVSENETFINICNFIDEHKIVHDILLYSFYMFNFYFCYLTARGLSKLSKRYFIIIILLIALGISLLKQFNMVIGLIVEIILLVILPIILNIKTKRYERNIKNILIPICYYALVNFWQLLIYLVRGITNEVLLNMPTLIYLILQIDYYIFIIITWIGVIYMFGGVGWLFGKTITELRALKEKELNKKNPDTKLIAEIEEVIRKKVENESK